MSEIWKAIPGYEGYYEVSNHGRVRSLPRIIRMDSGIGNFYNYHHNGKVLKLRLNNKGYCYVDLCKSRFLVHRLVAMVFIPNPNGYNYVNHKDENPKNNNAENLEWCTFQYNLDYGTCRARIGKHFWVAVIGIDKDGNKHYFSSIKEAAEETGISRVNISACCRNKKHYNTAGGYRWRYAKNE